MLYDTKLEACEEWVRGMNYIPTSVVEKLGTIGWVNEITPPSLYDRVYVLNNHEYGEIIKTQYNGDDNLYLVRLDSSEDIVLPADELQVDYESLMPMWGTMFEPEEIDKEWITGEYCEPHLQEVADCGFRIYDTEDFGILLGIDGAGYSFYGTEDDPGHWLKLYDARGLKWHKEKKA